VVAGEREPERQVETLLVEDLVQFLHVSDLLGLVSLVLAPEPGDAVVVVGDIPAKPALVRGADVRTAAVLGRDHRLAVTELLAQVSAEGAGVARVAGGVDADDVEPGSVDRLPRPGGVRQRSAEPAANGVGGLGEERVEPLRRPQTLYGLADSPVGLAAWLLDHGDGWGQPAPPVTSAVLGYTSHGHSAGDLTRDDVLDNITFYWLTSTAVSSARLYWENKLSLYNDADVSVPAAVSVFPGENYQAPRSWTERAYHNLIYFNEVDKGGHFAAWEQPQLFSEEVRAGFRPLHE
jgi:hypothetical protein